LYTHFFSQFFTQICGSPLKARGIIDPLFSLIIKEQVGIGLNLKTWNFLQFWKMGCIHLGNCMKEPCGVAPVFAEL
jgi:hypothetical protein